jgi:uncharacterized protein
MLGEDLDACEIDERGLCGDRAYALLDTSDGKVASAKNPRKWAALFHCHASFEEAPRAGAALPAVRIRLPDGTEVNSDQPSSDERLSTALRRGVKLNRRELSTEEIVETTLPNPWMPKLEEYWPEDITGLAHSGIVTDEAMPEGTFFDVAVVHLLTTATLARLQELYPAGRFDLHRFRPNLLIQPTEHRTEFVENDWIGRTVRIGEDVELRITAPCGRCVMTTLPQAGCRRIRAYFGRRCSTTGPTWAFTQVSAGVATCVTGTMSGSNEQWRSIAIEDVRPWLIDDIMQQLWRGAFDPFFGMASAMMRAPAPSRCRPR